MSYRARAKRRDANEAAIVAALRAAGAFVQLLNEGDGVPDLLVGFGGGTFLLEVKNPHGTNGVVKAARRKGSTGALTPDQVEWFSAWKGDRIHEVTTPAEALEAIGVYQ